MNMNDAQGLLEYFSVHRVFSYKLNGHDASETSYSDPYWTSNYIFIKFMGLKFRFSKFIQNLEIWDEFRDASGFYPLFFFPIPPGSCFHAAPRKDKDQRNGTSPRPSTSYR